MSADVAAVAAALEASALGVAARDWLWLYPLANVAHVLGVALLVGGIAVFDVSVLSRGPDVARVAVPVAITGAVLALPSGVVLFAADAGALAGNAVFWVKGGLIAAGALNAAVWHLVPKPSRGQAAVSLLAWSAALVAGRMIAYA